jgi:hypothetical protein
MKTAIVTGISRSIQAEKVFAEITRDGARVIAGIMKQLPLGTSNVVSLDATFATSARGTRHAPATAGCRVVSPAEGGWINGQVLRANWRVHLNERMQ